MKLDILHDYHAIKAAIVKNFTQVKEIYFKDNIQSKRAKELEILAKKSAIKIKILKKDSFLKQEKTLKSVSFFAYAKIKNTLNEEYLKKLVKEKQQLLLLILDEIQDSHNLGALTRNANAFGVDAVIICKNNSVKLNQGARNVAAGAAEFTPIIEVVNLARVIKFLKENNIWILGTSPNAKQSLFDLDLPNSIALILGNESQGMRKLTQEKCDFLAKIPNYGQVESINVSCASAVFLSQIKNQTK